MVSSGIFFEHDQRVHSPQLAAGLASACKIVKKYITYEDSPRLAAGSFNLRRYLMNIAEKSYVAMEYKLTLESGQDVDSSPEGKPLTFITGAGQIIPGLEKALIGKKAGDSDKITVEPEEAYGQVKQEMFREIPMSQFPDDVEIKPGMAFEAQGPQGPFMIRVAKINGNDSITVDLNHPLAGERLIFDITIVEVREPTADELAQLSAGCGCGTTEQVSCGSGCNCG